MEAYRDHLLRFHARSRHERFGGGMSDDFLIHYAEHCFGQGDLLYGAFVDGHLCGAAELRSNQTIWSEHAPFGRHISAEAAFSVENEHWRRGIGEKLFRRIRRAATNQAGPKQEKIGFAHLGDRAFIILGSPDIPTGRPPHGASARCSLAGRLRDCPVDRADGILAARFRLRQAAVRRHRLSRIEG